MKSVKARMATNAISLVAWSSTSARVPRLRDENAVASIGQHPC
jgi:hypothetical protein